LFSFSDKIKKITSKNNRDDGNDSDISN